MSIFNREVISILLTSLSVGLSFLSFCWWFKLPNEAWVIEAISAGKGPEFSITVSADADTGHAVVSVRGECTKDQVRYYKAENLGDALRMARDDSQTNFSNGSLVGRRAQ